MFVPFGTHVVDRHGKTVGTVSRLVLHPQTARSSRSSSSRACWIAARSWFR
jgi:hypothetical protein